MKKKLLILCHLLIPFHMFSMKRSSPFPPATGSRKPVNYDILSTPDDPIIDMIAKEIDEVSKDGYIGIESPSVSNSEIISALGSAAERGANITIFVNNPTKESELVQNTYKELIKRKVNVIVAPNLHTKRVIINKKNSSNSKHMQAVYIGSLNMTNNSPYNYEIMLLYTDPVSYSKNYAEQQKLKNPHDVYPVEKIDFISRGLLNTGHPEAHAAKKRFLEEFRTCLEPEDQLYFATYTLDDQEIVDALIYARKNSNKRITVILDGTEWQKYKNSTLKKLLLTDIDIYLFNKDRKEETPYGYPHAYPRRMHIKAILRECNKSCTALVSTANFTTTGKLSTNQDVWEPCTAEQSEKFKKIFNKIISKSSKLNMHDLESQDTPTHGTLLGKLNSSVTHIAI